MAVPKRRQSNAKTGSRRAHDAKPMRQLHFCSRCSQAIPSHVICPTCGHYMGREVVSMEAAEKA
jgi:large subunit ribosomal protein L32